jgi:hypothetical protein
MSCGPRAISPRVIEAMGGELEIRAVFPEASIRIKQFSSDKKRRHAAANK